MDCIPLFPLRTLLFPHTDLGIHAFEDRYQDLVSRCLDSGLGFGVTLIRSGAEVGGPADPHPVGTLAEITAHARLPDGRYLLEVEGTRRFRIRELESSAPYPQAEVSWIGEPVGDFGTARTMSDEVGRLFRGYLSRLGAALVDLPANPVARSYMVASGLLIDPPEKQMLLEVESSDERLRAEARILRRELALIEHIRSQGR